MKRGRYKQYLEPGQDSPKVPKPTLYSERRRRSLHPACAGPSQEDAVDDREGNADDSSSSDETDAFYDCPEGDDYPSEAFSSIEGDDESNVEEDPTVRDHIEEDFEDFINEYGDRKLPHQDTTVLQGLLLILTFVVSAGLSWSQVDLLLKLINGLFGANVFPNTKYGFRKVWNLQKKHVIRMHYFCDVCHYKMQPLSTEVGAMFLCNVCSGTANETKLVKKGSLFVTLDLRRQLQYMLKHLGEAVGSTLQRLASSPVSPALTDITDGVLYREARQRCRLSDTDLTITVNSDGSPVFKSSKSSVWPIQVMLNELPVPLRWKNIIVAALWFAREHPPVHLFMKVFVDELNNIGTILWTHAWNAVRSRVFAVSCCVDSPARAALLNSKQYNGYYGCSWCLQKGTSIEGTVKYPFDGDSMVERTHEMVLQTMKAAAHKGRIIDGIKGPSPVAKLSTLDLVWGLPPDYLHCVLEGVTAQLMDLWLTSTGTAWYIGTKLQLLDDRICCIRPPVMFTRLPRAVSERAFWKATEWKFWILYYALPCLQDVLPNRFLKHLALLSHSTFLLLKKRVEERDIAQAGQLLQDFVKEVPNLYGETAATFNIHQLLHLSKSVRMTGPLWATSTFPFEGGNGDLLKLVSAANCVPMQIAERCVLQQSLKYLTVLVDLPPVLRIRQEELAKRNTKSFETSVLGCPTQDRSTLDSAVRELFVHHMRTVPDITEYSRACVGGFILHSCAYKRTEKTCSEFIRGTTGQYYRVMRIFSLDSKVMLVCQTLITSNAYGSPHLHTCEHPPPGEGLCLLFEQDVSAICVHVEQKSRCFVADIPNYYETD